MRYWLSSVSALALVLAVTPAWAQSRVDQLGAAAAASGTDTVPACQGCNSSTPVVGLTLAQIKTYVGGAFTLISTQTASNSASLDFTGLGTSAAGVNTIFIDCNSIILAASGDQFAMQVGEGGGPTWQTASYYVEATYANAGANSVFAGSNQSSGRFLGLISNSAGFSGSFKIWISGLASTSLYKPFNYQTITLNGAGANAYYSAVGGGSYQGDTNAVTGMRFLGLSSNITSGQCSMYKVTP